MAADAFASWQLACPECRAPLALHADCAACTGCATVFPKRDGIWRCLAPARADAFSRFAYEYHTVRRAEGWGVAHPDYYRSLPWRDRSGRFGPLWRIRARSFATLVRRVLTGSGQRVLDLGAGNCWLAYRLTQLGHQVAAIDIQTDALDGLGAHVHYDAQFSCIQAEFDRLPFADQQVDVAVFNGSLHYTPDYEGSLREILRVLRPNGTVAIVDTPMYSTAHSGQRMIVERYARFRRAYGFSSDALDAEQFMTRERLRDLGRALGLRWQLIVPFHGVLWTLRPWWARLRGHREPAQFPLMIGTRA